MPATQKSRHRPWGISFFRGECLDFSKTTVARQQSELLQSIKCTPNFALRLGKTVWRDKSWTLKSDKLKKLLKKQITVDELTEWDIHPIIEQKTVDMKIGLDLAIIASKRLADVLIMITGDSDIIPVLKYARREGMIVGLDSLRNPIQPELSEHVDFTCSQLAKYQGIREGQRDQSVRVSVPGQ